MSKLLAVAALSARMLAEAARDGGYRVVALDAFGDADTRRAAKTWQPIGATDRLAIDGPALLTALRQLRHAGAVGWVAGSGFEAQPELLAAAAKVLPPIGNSPAVLARVRDPASFFGCLEALGIAYPETRFDRPQTAAGWLRKNAASCGGWEVWPAEVCPSAEARGAGVASCAADAVAFDASGRAGAGAAIYYQRRMPGTPMSALFLADGRQARLLGVNRQLVRRLGGRPYVFRGCIGPLAVPPVALGQLTALLDALSANFGLRGLNGLDFLLDGERLFVLELNARPPASIALYRDLLPGGLMRAHLAACLGGSLPAPAATMAGTALPPRGFEVLYARRSQSLGDEAASALSRAPWCHDLPVAGAAIERGAPVCTVSAAGPAAAEVRRELRRRGRQISFQLELADERSKTKCAGRALECQ